MQTTTANEEPAARHRHEHVARDVESVAHHLRGTSLNRALDVIGDWWTQRILRESFLGVRNFEEFQAALSIPRQTLSERLKSLVAHGVLDESRGGYRLTPCGLALYPWVLMIWRWTRKWGGELAPRHPGALRHYDCGHLMTPVFACGECLEEVTLRDVDYVSVPSGGDGGKSGQGGAMAAGAVDARRKRWTGGKFAMEPERAGHHIAFITADRWTHLILASVFLGCRSFDRIGREIGISSNILAQRLALLVDSGFLEKERHGGDARRFHYSLTPRSRDVFPLTIALVQWADQHLPGGGSPPQVRIHRDCGARLHAKVICSHCHGELQPRAVGFMPLEPAH